MSASLFVGITHERIDDLLFQIDGLADRRSVFLDPIHKEEVVSDFLDDFPLYFQLVNDTKVMAMITERAIEREKAKADYKKMLENNRLSPDCGNFKILNEETNEFIGLGKLEIEDHDSQAAELGYMILPAHWGKGIAGKVAKQLIERARKQPSIKTIYAMIDPNNLPSRKVLINNGFASKELTDFDGLPGELLELRIQ